MRSLSLCGNKSFGHFTQIQNYNDLSCEYMLGSLWGSEGGPFMDLLQWLMTT